MHGRRSQPGPSLTCAVFVADGHAGPTKQSLCAPAEVCSRQPLKFRGRPTQRKISLM
ncbi:hypothetical protein BN9982_1260009 [Mycobacterium tuberculosis]|nr:hypothetical protein BN9982_1260009 [Mycobacterium tuberculosis]